MLSILKFPALVIFVSEAMGKMKTSSTLLIRYSYESRACPSINRDTLKDILKLKRQNQGCNARKVISEVYTSFVLHCTVYTRRMSKPDIRIHLSHKKYRKLLCELSKLSNLMLLYVRRVYATAINFPCITSLVKTKLSNELE